MTAQQILTEHFLDSLFKIDEFAALDCWNLGFFCILTTIQWKFDAHADSLV